MTAGPDPAGRGEIVATEDAAGPLLRFSGAIDREAVRRFRLLAPPSSWPSRVDLAAVTSLDAAGLELLVHLDRKPRRRGGELALLALPAHLRPALERAGLARLLPRANGTATSV
jgi:anti-anti-sigma factor